MTNKILIVLGLGLVVVFAVLMRKGVPPTLQPVTPKGASAVPEQGGQKQIQFPEYDNVSGRIKSLLTGEKAVQAGAGMMRITGMRLETYEYDGAARKVDLIIEAPECLFSFRTHIASSDGPMTLRRADGDASLRGRGFEWRQRESVLTISNDVETVTKKGFSIDE